MKKLIFIIVLGNLFLLAKPVLAIYIPQDVPNNRFGIHIIDENDLNDAASLLNSSGGDWGYVKLVIREDDRNRDKWQEVFDRMRRLHMIPVVRLATKVENGAWVKPRVEDIGSWVDFLDSLNWVIENRYVIIFNEPNHAKEWGGTLNPEEYGWYLKEFSRRLKEKSTDFFILPAGLDASAPDGYDTMDEWTFLSRMIRKEPDVFTFIDGWTSHSYPNPDFSGSPNASGRGSIRNYQWELSQLARLGFTENLPVFIAETGWRHNQGKHLEISYLSPEIIADYFATAFTYAWNDDRIIAVIPFLLNYQAEPFDHFSWKKFGVNEFYPIFTKVRDLQKMAGKPKQSDAAMILDAIFPEKLVTDSEYTFYVDIENRGQTILGYEEGWELRVSGLPTTFTTYVSRLSSIDPYQRTRVEVKIQTPKILDSFVFDFQLTKAGRMIATKTHTVMLIPPPSLVVYAQHWLKGNQLGTGYNLLIYNSDQNLIHKTENLEFENGETKIADLYNVIPYQTYRLVLTKTFYLPRQIYSQLTEGQSFAEFPPLLPLDPSGDGKLDLSDLGAFLYRPISTIGLILAL